MDIDIILTWVDNEDPDWQVSFRQWKPVDTGDLNISEARYRNWHLLRYWFRGVEQFAPWIRKIHFVTNGQLPVWLDTDHPKLNFVKHSDIMPPEVLPTFNSNAIEMNLFKIEGLSENFIYFNDDIFLVGAVEKEYFFRNGLPCDIAVTWYRNRQGGIMRDIVNNNLRVINNQYCKYGVMLRHFCKWFHLSYGLHQLRDNLIALIKPRFAGFMEPHTALPMQKHTIKEIWQAYKEELTATTSHRFRSSEDVNPWLFRYWRLCKGEFSPQRQNKQSRYYFNLQEQKFQIARDIAEKKVKIVVLNDSDQYENYEQLGREIADIFRKILPNRCSFEKD